MAFLKRKVQRLIVPYIVLSAVFLLLDPRLFVPDLSNRCIAYFIVSESSSIDYLVRALLDFIRGLSVPCSAPLWFLATLFISNCVLYFLAGIKKRIFIVIISIVFLSVAWVLSKYKIQIPFANSFIATFYVIWGYLSKEIVSQIEKAKNLTLIGSLFIIWVIYFYGININGMPALSGNLLGPSLYGLIIATISGIYLVVFCSIIISRMSSFYLLFYLQNILHWVARNSIPIIAVHYWVIVLCQILDDTYVLLGNIVVKFLLISLACVLFVRLFRNIKPFLFGL